MNEYQRSVSTNLKAMSSEEAAKWIIMNHPKDGSLFLTARSWLKDDQLLLANHFLKNIPHASGNCYDQLLSVMAIKSFLKVVEIHLGKMNEDNKQLLIYYTVPALKKAVKSEKDNFIIEIFIKNLS